ncbi:hypothetical protein BCR35DRAFT_161436 [Leucosporidium creatinivorum]|uniref:Uncharacterized protein n=1 Tax=Leucosporidium creatinivorum TaxID=106004 RepID=A0A1Y2EMJ8_9BASI|nr:hypothetical protein BCR35DRAFT_161436 [Leucosporidium creatinivorum]
MAGLQLFPFIACLESTWRYRRYMQFVTTHQHIDDIALDSIPQRRSSRRDPTARHSTTNRASPTYAQPPGDSTATDSDTHQRRVSPHQVTHSHYGALPRSTTFSRPTSSATLDPYDTHPEHRGASLPFSLSHGRREAREEGSEDESSDSLAPVLPRRSSRQSSKRRG